MPLKGPPSGCTGPNLSSVSMSVSSSFRGFLNVERSQDDAITYYLFATGETYSRQLPMQAATNMMFTRCDRRGDRLRDRLPRRSPRVNMHATATAIATVHATAVLPRIAWIKRV